MANQEFVYPPEPWWVENLGEESGLCITVPVVGHVIARVNPYHEFGEDTDDLPQEIAAHIASVPKLKREWDELKAMLIDLTEWCEEVPLKERQDAEDAIEWDCPVGEARALLKKLEEKDEDS